ncbi:4-hydroxy-tetrahydrodipicolinate reductase [Pseudoalteromonas sp. NBT06-2]|uniref:4-hydroxy-tetrahydrodipicolinate reductase n=1 Tax=Pseudoalteromonas sp. NBT06-2 TaxID=2025950 RepID=UPI000BA7E3F8|nr:4-hydroxy-tetrahydrodipicolinate reductase [Pseudoalteromonas sp. NBT06-2]PAJ75691.1 4-hydroxy-tetrahydrodipicolinate reductase [Pseudoalteromonas sp. NBT06-2]
MNHIGIFGANGRMGRALLEVVSKDQNSDLTAFCRTGSQHIGGDLSATILGSKERIILKDESEAIHDEIDVFIDFTLPQGLKKHLAEAVKNKTAMVIGTTGLTAEDMCELEQASKEIPIVFSRNYSVGINVLLNLVKTIATTLDEDVDIEIFEAHHRHKIDAPSGTALAIGESIADAKGWDHDEVAKYDRTHDEVEKTQNEIGYSVVRSGDIVGEHTAYFSTMGERLELTHKASSRITFAQGALRAAAWLKKQPVGLYTMQDVLGLTK